MWLMMLGMALFWALIVCLSILSARLLFPGGSPPPRKTADPLTPREVLDLRYTRGEITREQYEQMKKDLAI